jgi:hypothetical protein
MSGQDWSDYQFTINPESGIYIDVLRNSGAIRMLEDKDSDFLFFLDADNGFKPDAFKLFMEDFEDPNVHVVTGYYVRRDKAMTSTMGIRPPNYPDNHWDMSPMQFVGTKGLINLSTHGGSVSGSVPTGCLMVRREVFENVERPWFQDGYIETRGVGLHHQGEDCYFSQKVQDAGYDVYVDTRIKSAHMEGNVCYPPELKPY